MVSRAKKASKPATKKLGLNGRIDYEWMDKTPGGGNLGHAEFVFCPVWVRGVMKKLLVYPRQQRVKVRCYEVDLAKAGKVRNFSFHSWSHETDNPWCWRMWWCKEHKCVEYEVYVPKNTNTLTFVPHFGDSVDIHFGRDGR